MVDVLGTALGLAPFAEELIRALVGKNTHRNLIALVEADLRASHRVPGAQRQSVAKAWAGQCVDPELGGRLVAWLATGREEHLVAAMEIWRALLRNRLGRSDVDIDALVEVTAEIVRGHLADAQASDRDALRAVGGDIKDHVTRELLALSDARPDTAGRVRFNLPTVTALFTGRDEELIRLERALATDEGVVITQAIGGLGGIGKSQLAAAYVRAHVEEYEIVAWVGAEDGAIAQLAQLAARLGVGTDELAPSDRAQLTLAYLAECEQRWLLVLDNVTSAEQLAGLLPGSGNGRVLVTSRDRALRQFGPVLTLGVFDEDTATQYLIDGAQRPDDAAAARLVAQALGCLPLALSHAAAYCAAGTSFAAYLQLLEGLPARELFDSNPEASYTRTVASTWKASIQAATACAPLAADVLELAAQLAPDAITKSLFDVLVNDAGPGARKRLSSAFNALARFSLATVDDATLGVHRLLQKVVRDDAVQRGDHSAAVRALCALTEAFPEDPGQPELWAVSERLLTHVFALADNLRESSDAAVRLIELLNRACHYLGWAERGRRALEASTTALAHADRLLGAEHPSTLIILNHVAGAYQDAGRTIEAIAIYEQLLPILGRVQGAEDPSTLATRHKLAFAYQAAGRAREAIAIYEQLLPIRQRVQGAAHPNTLTTLHELASAYQAAGGASEAIAIYEPLLPLFERVLGAEHPSTLATRHELAFAYRDAGRTRDAAAIYEQLLPIRERVLGAEHPSTLTTRHNLASAYEDAGRTSEAVAIYEQLLSIRERVQGAEHPSTLTTRNNLASAYQDAGSTCDAVAIYEQLLPIRERVQGAEHPSTLGTRKSLADAYHASRRTSEAIAIYKQLLPILKRVQGAAHPSTLTARHHLAIAYHASGREREAITIYEQLLSIRERVQGANHPDTLITRNTLAIAYRAVGRASDAERLDHVNG